MAVARRRIGRRPTLDMEMAFQECRGPLKHAWEFWTPPADAKYGTGWGYRIARLCTRCGAVSYCQVNAHGHREPWRYKHSEGYSLPADEVPTQEQLVLSIMAAQGIEDYYGDEPVIRGVRKRKATKTTKAAKKTNNRRRAS